MVLEKIKYITSPTAYHVVHNCYDGGRLPLLKISAWQSDKRLYWKHKWRRGRVKCRFGKLNRHHGSEPDFPDPAIVPLETVPLIAKEAALNNLTNAEFWRQYCERLRQARDVMSANDISNVLDSLVAINYRNVELMKLWSRELVDDVKQLRPEECAVIANGYAHFNCYSPDLMKALADHTLFLIHPKSLMLPPASTDQHQPQMQIAGPQHQQSSSQLMMPPGDSPAPAPSDTGGPSDGPRDRALAAGFTPRSLGVLLNSYAKLNHYHPLLLQKAAEGLAADASEQLSIRQRTTARAMSLSDYANVLVPFARFAYRRRGDIEEGLSGAGSRLGTDMSVARLLEAMSVPLVDKLEMLARNGKELLSEKDVSDEMESSPEREMFLREEGNQPMSAEHSYSYTNATGCGNPCHVLATLQPSTGATRARGKFTRNDRFSTCAMPPGVGVGLGIGSKTAINVSSTFALSSAASVYLSLVVLYTANKSRGGMPSSLRSALLKLLAMQLQLIQAYSLRQLEAIAATHHRNHMDYFSEPDLTTQGLTADKAMAEGEQQDAAVSTGRVRLRLSEDEGMDESLPGEMMEGEEPEGLPPFPEANPAPSLLFSSPMSGVAEGEGALVAVEGGGEAMIDTSTALVRSRGEVLPRGGEMVEEEDEGEEGEDVLPRVSIERQVKLKDSFHTEVYASYDPIIAHRRHRILAALGIALDALAIECKQRVGGDSGPASDYYVHMMTGQHTMSEDELAFLSQAMEVLRATGCVGMAPSSLVSAMELFAVWRRHVDDTQGYDVTPMAHEAVRRAITLNGDFRRLDRLNKAMNLDAYSEYALQRPH
ncbi:unnamed protein product [Vitrella brassicaformis CCMP3155]|uniref:Uncharacterized protein n=2 Tax=Vitrella brassicaformis TaxID=1169539 RepID=A0A0G4F285_VITBC|nr:unnamed protein product [Vitrella brassicaformis CCMP3155]|eukprot:CEM06175.1 unnamed protein product [Vitrella brassicaformis CCMP3155]